MVLSQEPLMNLGRTLLESFCLALDKKLSFHSLVICSPVWNYMLIRMVEHLLKKILRFNVLRVDFVLNTNSFKLQQIKSMCYDNILFIILKSFGFFFLDHPVAGSLYICYDILGTAERQLFIYSYAAPSDLYIIYCRKTAIYI